MTNQENNWEKEWDKKFFKFHEIGAIENSDEMKPFIRNLLAEVRAKEYRNGSKRVDKALLEYQRFLK